MGIVKNIAAIAKGMSITFGEMFKPTEVENYPDGPGPNRGAMFQERFRGMHVLQRDENGLEKCVACFLCAAACPSNCIYIEAAENTETNRISGAERYAKVYNIDYNRCIFCGYCVEACPTDAITHGHGFELATLQRQQSGLPQRAVARRHSGARRLERHLQHRRNGQADAQARAIQFRSRRSSGHIVGRCPNRDSRPRPASRLLHLTVHSRHFAGPPAQVAIGWTQLP